MEAPAHSATSPGALCFRVPCVEQPKDVGNGDRRWRVHGRGCGRWLWVCSPVLVWGWCQSSRGASLSLENILRAGPGEWLWLFRSPRSSEGFVSLDSVYGSIW